MEAIFSFAENVKAEIDLAIGKENHTIRIKMIG
jgi:hypothetical protein